MLSMVTAASVKLWDVSGSCVKKLWKAQRALKICRQRVRQFPVPRMIHAPPSPHVKIVLKMPAAPGWHVVNLQMHSAHFLALIYAMQYHVSAALKSGKNSIIQAYIFFGLYSAVSIFYVSRAGQYSYTKVLKYFLYT